MLGPDLVDDNDSGKTLESGLADLEQQALVIGDRYLLDGAERLAEVPFHDTGDRLEGAVQKNGADQRLIGIRQDGGLFPALVHLLPPAEEQVLTEAQVTGDSGERRFIDELCAFLGEDPFSFLCELSEQPGRDDRVDDGVAEELQPLIILEILLPVFIDIRGVGQ